MAKRKSRRRRTTSEKVMIVMSVVIAVSMILALFAAFAPGGNSGVPSGALLNDAATLVGSLPLFAL